MQTNVILKQKNDPVLKKFIKACNVGNICYTNLLLSYMRKKKPEKLADFEKLTFSSEILERHQLYRNINFSDSKCKYIE